jgi:hypothetical protein
MAVTLNANTSTGFIATSDTSGVLQLQTGGTTAVTVDASQNVTLAGTLTATGVTTVPAGTVSAPAITTTGDTNTGIFFPAADTIAFAEGGVESMRIDSSGNVGIGVTPTGKAKLEVYTGVGDFAGISTRFNATNLPISLGVTNSNGVPYLGVNTRQVSGTDGQTYDINGFASRMWCNGGGFSFFTAASGTAGNTISFTQAMTLDASGNVGVGVTNPSQRLDLQNGSSDVSIRFRSPTNSGYISYGTDNSLQFLTSSNERARIDSSGNLLVGATSTPNGTSVSGTLIQNPNTARNRSATTVSSQVIHWSFYNGNGEVGGIYTNGSATTFYTSSDYRLKENVSRMTGALDKVTALNPVTYKWKVDGTEGQGFIAHELKAVIPDAVKGEKDAVDSDGNPEYQGIDTSFLVATLTAAIQEQQAIITQLQADVAALKGASA